MTPQGLTKLKGLATEVDELREKADDLNTRIRNLYVYEEDILDQDAHLQISSASSAMRDSIPCMAEALIMLKKAYIAEMALMDFYAGLLNREEYDKARFEQG